MQTNTKKRKYNSRMYRKCLTSLFFFLLVFSNRVSAEVVDDSLFEKDTVETTHDYLSRQVVSFAEYIDSFFGRYTRTDKKNRTRITILNTTSLQEGQYLKSSTELKARLNLPHLEELLKFKVKKEGRVETGVPGDNLKEQINNTPEESHYFFMDWKLTTQVGVDVDLSPDVFIRNEQKFEIGGRRNVTRLINSVYWFGRSGLGDTLTLENDTQISKNLLFRLSNTGTWASKSGDINYSHGPELYYTLSDNSNISYDIKANALKSNESTWIIDSYSSSIVYNMRLKPSWILMTTGPRVEYPRSQNFKSHFSYFIQFQVFIGSF